MHVRMYVHAELEFRRDMPLPMHKPKDMAYPAELV